jgi:L-threonylcarbamoyladenylate synthase
MSQPYVHITEQNVLAAAQHAAEVIRAGGVILYPTDTVYGLGCDPANPDAVAKIARIKQRDVEKMMILIAPSISVVERYVVFDERSRALAAHFWPGPLSLVLSRILEPDKRSLPHYYPHEATIVFRVPDHPLCQAIMHELDAPLVSTSANRAGMDTCVRPKDILDQLDALADHIDLVLDAGDAQKRVPSTLLSVRNDEVNVLREGAITHTQIESVISSAL